MVDSVPITGHYLPVNARLRSKDIIFDHSLTDEYLKVLIKRRKMLKLNNNKLLLINMTLNLSSQVIRYGVSGTFNALIDGLRDTPGISEKKFRLADVNKLAQYLVCRNYGMACLELSYLLWAVVNYPNKDPIHSNDNIYSATPLLSFFWLNENITPSRFRQAFVNPYQTRHIAIKIEQTGLHLSLPRQSFIITPPRVGLLAVLFELIISLAPEKLALIESSLQGHDEDSEQQIKKLSSDLQKQIYQFLTEHLVPAQQQRRFRYISQWLAKTAHTDSETYLNKNLAAASTKTLAQANSTKNPPDALPTPQSTQLLTDASVLSFWQYAAIDESSPGYKLYASAFNDIVETHQAIQQAQQALALDNAHTIGFDVEAGEYSPDMIETLLFEQSSSPNSHAWLCSSPKFLTKSQWRFIEPLMQKQNYINNLPLSFARLVIFGQWQASIVQAKRKSSAMLKAKLNQLPEQNYLLYQQHLATQVKVITQVILSISHIFYHHQDSRYLGYIIEFFSKTTRAEIKDTVLETMNLLTMNDNLSDEFATLSTNKILFIKSQTLLKDSLELTRTIKAAKQAFSLNNKDGFQNLPAIECLDTYQDGYDGLTQCRHIIKRYLSHLAKEWPNTEACQSNYGSDVSIFTGMFDQLYGAVNDQ